MVLLKSGADEYILICISLSTSSGLDCFAASIGFYSASVILSIFGCRAGKAMNTATSPSRSRQNVKKLLFHLPGRSKPAQILLGIVQSCICCQEKIILLVVSNN